MTAQMTDFGNSYMTWDIPADLNDKRVPGHKPWGNSARILIDARCTIINDATGAKEEIYLIAPCRTEWMYQETGMIQNPSGEYRVIFTQDRQLTVGKRITEEVDRTGSGSTAGFNSLTFTVREHPAVTVLDTDEAVVQATEQFLPINAKTEIRNEERGLRAILEYPIRTMNIHPVRRRFQVDTGPIVFPDLSGDTEHLLDLCKLAHTVYNTLDYAEFVCKQPTPLLKDGEEVAKIYHYSDYHNLPAVHTFYGAGTLA